MSILPACPNCGTRVPFVRTQWARGAPFVCKGCHARLVLPKTTLVALGVVIGLSLGFNYIEGWAQKIGLGVALFLIAFLVESAVAKPRIAPPA